MTVGSKYISLCIKAIQNEISDPETKRLQKWLVQSPNNKAYFDRMKDTWERMNFSSNQAPTFAVEAEWQEFERMRNREYTVNRPSYVDTHILMGIQNVISKIIHPNLRPVYLAIMLIVGFTISSYIIRSYLSHQVVYRTCVTADKQKLQISFPDGSTVCLNSGSSIRFPETFSKQKREINLRGEAYFEVVKDKRPFYVITDNAKTKVLGTAFNVWSRNNVTRVMVKEGRVQFSSTTSDSVSVILVKDKISQITNGIKTPTIHNIDTDRFIGWREGRLSFEKCPLSEFIPEIERQYGVHIHVNPDSSQHFSVTGTFDHLDVEQILDSICLTFDMESDRDVNGDYLLQPKTER
ncbi:FecR domain-containing protein [candidate division KSB1 bacterium]|nr:FecR domain-containing protein [candidate division KSB1 bacterium]